MMVSVGLVGCVNLGQPPSMAVKIPEQFQKNQANQETIQAQKKLEATWWRAAHDPVLDNIILNIEQENPSLRQARARLQAARAARNLGQYLPNLSVGTDVQYNHRLQGNAALDPLAINSTKKNTGQANIKLDASWELPLYGQVGAALQRKRAGVVLARADEAHIRLSLTAEAVRLYAQMRLWQNTLKLRQQSEAAYQQIAAYKTIKFNAGLIDIATRIEAERRALSAQQDTRLAEAELTASQYQLSTVVGITEIPVMWNEPKPVPAIRLEAIGQTPADILRERPDIRRAEAAVAQQASALKLSQSELYPKFTLTGTLSHLSNVVGNPLPGTTVQISGVPAVSIPLLDWGQRAARVRQENARLAETIEAYREVVIQAMNEAAEFFAAYETAEQNLTVARQQKDLQEKEASLAALQFQEGRVSGIEQQQAEILKLEATIAELNATTNQVTYLASLAKALGVTAEPLPNDKGAQNE